MSEYPEHEKQRAVVSESQAIGEFIDGLPYMGHGMAIYECVPADCVVRVERWQPTSRTITSILAEYFDIDLVKIEQERRLMLDSLQATKATR